jgi:glyceraldehyde 3-phosphate dehydrogenase
MSIKVAINGFGRIGRQALRAIIEKRLIGELEEGEIEVVAVNDLADAKTLAHLLKYDSVYGVLPNKIEGMDSKDKNFVGEINIDGDATGVLSEPDPAKLPWKKLGVDIVVESTGRFTDKESASLHLKAGAKNVIISAPAKGGGVDTIVLGVNSENLSSKDKIISNASCTTNCIAPIMKMMNDRFGVQKSMMTTIHAYTADQVLVDGPHKDLRRARSAAINTIPTTTGAAIAATLTIPELKGKFDGLSIRVPVPVGSISDMVMLLKKEVTVEEVNSYLEEACAEEGWHGIVRATYDPLVSSDIVGDPHSAIIDLSLTQVVDGDLVKVVAWYDNEWGYSNRLVEQIVKMAK